MNKKSKIAKYSLMAGAALTMLAACKKDKDDNDPNIIETDVNPDISLTAPTNNGVTQNIDINADGQVDVVVAAYNYTYVNDNINYGGIYGANGSEVLSQAVTFSLGSYNYTDTFLTPLSDGNTIGPNQTIWESDAFTGITGSYYGYNISAGPFLNQNKYVGVRFQSAGNTHYAWLKMSVSATGNNIVVSEYAYHATPNTAITAGDK